MWAACNKKKGECEMAQEQKTLVVEATMENLQTVMDFVENQLLQEECPAKVTGQILVSLEELNVNVVNYAYDDVGECQIITDIQPCEGGKRLTMTIRDSGKPFNPLEKEDPDITLSADERQIGGLGIYMVKKSMDEVTYENSMGYNTLTICKKW